MSITKIIPSSVRQRLSNIRHQIGLVRNFARGYREFRQTGKSPEYGYASMRELFWRTNGRSNDLCALLLSALSPRLRVHDGGGIFADFDDLSIARVVRDIRSNGYHVFDQRLPKELCEQLALFATTVPCRPLIANSSRLTGIEFKYGDPTVFDGGNPRYARCDFDEQKVLETLAVQQILSDPSLLKISTLYLRCTPAITGVEMWWSTASLKEPSSEAAQLYHFDMDWIKFLKFFVYLTDVTPSTGPHCFVAGSHRRKPAALLRDGRFHDRELERHYAPERFVEITGPRGTIIAADTRGFHKGKPLETGNRLIFQVEFAVNLFGCPRGLIEVNEGFTPRFIDLMDRYPSVYPHFVRRCSGLPSAAN